jgi:singapore isolate B (sub-type 7) whole genome shotgun sequence assembly, scaffold_1
LLDLLKECAEHFTELDIESIFVVMKIAGFKLRGDSPSDLKDLILAIKQKADSDEWK